MKTKLLFLITFLSFLFSFSQDLIAVQNGNTPTFYEDLSEAITNSVAGDTLYLPGKSYTISATINKSLHFVGVGYNSNSTLATNRTVINGSPQIILDEDADFGSMTGVYFSNTGGSYPVNNVQFKGNVIGYNISRCYFTNGLGLFDSTGNPQSITISENVINKLQFGFDSGSNNLIANNVFTRTRSHIANSVVKNNIFLDSYDGLNDPYYGITVENCLVENNIFKDGGSLYYNYKNNNVFRNNLNDGLNGVGANGNQGSGNFLDGVDLTTIFVNYDGSYNESITNFHLIDGSSYSNAGRDGTDLGIYGGPFPWKDGSIPFNPHIVSKDVSGTTDQNGNLPVTIEVQAQQN